MASPTMPVSHPVPLSTLYVSPSARCHCFCALCPRWLTSGPSSGLLALCLARPLPGCSYPSICVSRSDTRVVHIPPAPWRPALVGRLGQALYLLACLRSILALSSSRFYCSCRASWAPGLCMADSCFVYCSVRRYIVFRIPHRHFPLDPPACTLPAVCRGRSHSQSFPASFSRFIRGSFCRRSC